MGNAYAALCKQRALCIVQPAAMRRDGCGGEDAALVQQGGRPFPVQGQTVADLFFRLGKVDVDAGLLLFCKRRTPLQPLG